LPRVAAIAIDAAEWNALGPLMDDGRLPALARLRDRSRRCRLDNVVPYRSEQVWPQFLSGRDAEANQYWSTESFDPDTYEPYCQGTYVGAPFYAHRSLRTIVLDLPFLPLSRGVDGLQVTAWGVHGPHYLRASMPQGLLTEIDERFGPHPAFENDFDLGWFSPQYIEALSAALRRGAHTRLDVARMLQDRMPDWELLLTSMSEVHSAGHHFWHGVDPTHPLRGTATATLAARRYEDVAREVDTAVGRFIDELPPDTTVVLFALHGMIPADDSQSMILLPELFHRLHFGQKLLRTPDPETWRRNGLPFVVPTSDRAWAVMTWLRRHFAPSVVDRVKARAIGAVPGRFYELARRAVGRPAGYRLGELREPIPPETELTPEEIVDTQAIRKDMEWQPAAWYRPWWPKMRFFALPTFTDAHIRINLAGRERDGIVAAEDYERTCEEVIAIAASLTDPRTGKPILAAVHRPRAADPMARNGPDSDLLLVWSSAVDAIEHPEIGIVGPVPYVRTGAHNAKGWAMFSGPGIEPGELDDRPAVDLPPTILELLGHEPPADMHGESLASALRASRIPEA
jgi:predicted AlkP superfamily phosphohydrolase/phosphomutase